MPWPIVYGARPHGSDLLYTIWEFSALYPFWMDRVRVRSSLKDHLHSLHPPTPACSIVRVSCAAEVGSVRRWLARTVHQARPSRPAWASWAAKATKIIVQPIPTIRRRFCNIAR
eukprot:6733045-Pyramimonas_sp.AAC.1